MRSPSVFLDSSVRASFFAHDTRKKAAHRVLLPACRLHYRGDRRTFRLAQQGNHGCLLRTRARRRDTASFRAMGFIRWTLAGGIGLLYELVAGHVGILSSLSTAPRAVTTEAPHWRKCRRGRIPGTPMALCKTRTVTLRLQRKSSPFCEKNIVFGGCFSRSLQPLVARERQTTNLGLGVRISSGTT